MEKEPNLEAYPEQEGLILSALNYKTLAVAEQLCDKFVGQGLYTEKILRSAIEDEKQFFYLLFSGQKPIGYFYGQYNNARKLKEIPGLTYELIRGLCKEENTVGVCRSIGIEKEYRNKGISDWMLSYFTKRLMREFHVDVIISLAWKKDSCIPADRLLQRCGYRHLRDIERPWHRETSLVCPYCEKKGCICDAALFYQKVSK